jgi:methyl-accepting chemotaxis protein
MLSERPHSDVTGAEAALGAYLRLEEAIDNSLTAVVTDTESSAREIISNVRRLHDSASTLVTYLDGTSLQAGDLGAEIKQSVAFLAEIGAFIERLPAKTEHDLANVQAIVKEILSLSAMTADVQAISLQSHLLALNVAIEAGRAGSAGATFKVLADEMRKLAGNSRSMAMKMSEGLSRARQIVEGGLKTTITESSQQLAEVSKTTASINKLRANFDDMSQYYKTRFAIVTKHNEDLVKEIAEVLGQIQYQDVVRQCIERTRVATGRRNAALSDSLAAAEEAPACLAQLPQQLELILSDYLSEEQNHSHSTRQTSGEDAPLKIELF